VPTRIKFCGLTRAEDVLCAADLGVEALGFVCVPASKRFVSAPLAAALVQLTPPFVQTIGLFQDAGAEQVREAIKLARFSMLQFHGHEDDAFCASFGLPFIKAVAMADLPDLLAVALAFPRAKALLLDSHSLINPQKTGGSGHTFTWRDLPDPDGSEALPSYIILAGGLDSSNVGAGIAAVRPWAVDVSSGIESAPGHKDAAKMHAFVAAVRD
jgi:phosphoribosylanthranilate isomerase